MIQTMNGYQYILARQIEWAKNQSLIVALANKLRLEHGQYIRYLTRRYL